MESVSGCSARKISNVKQFNFNFQLSKLYAKETSRILRNDCLGIKKRESVNSYALIKILDALFEMFPTGQMCI